MVCHIPKKTIIIVLISTFVLSGIAGGVYFFLKNEKKSLIQQEQSQTIQIHARPDSKEVIENSLYKRVDFINKLISDFNLNATTGEDIFYKNSKDEFIPIELTSLMNLSIKELAEVRMSIEKNGVFLEKDKNYIPRPETTVPAPIQ